MHKIAFWRSIGAAYAFVFGKPLRLLRTGGLWLAILALYALWLLLPGTMTGPTSAADALRHGGIGIALLLFYYFGLISFAVAWHRAVLLNEDRGWLAALRFRRREWRFLGNSILLMLLIGVPFACAWFVAGYILLMVVHVAHTAPRIVTLIFAAGGIASSAVAWIFACRLALVFPAVAADGPGEPIAETWQQSRGNWLRLYFASIICVLPPLLFGWWLDRITAVPVHKYAWALAGGAKYIVGYGGEFQAALGLLADILQYAVLIAFYSIAYRQLPPPSTAAPAPQPAE